MEHLSDFFLEPMTFVPAQIARGFNIQTTDLIEQLLLPKVLKLQQDEAPKLQVSFQNVGFSFPKQALETGNVDLAIAGFFGVIPDGFYQKKLFTDTFRCCVSRRHPKIKKAIDLATYLAHPHILIAPGGTLHGHVDQVLTKHKCRRHIAVGTSSFLTAGWAVAQSEAILTAPASLIANFEQYLPIRSFDMPITLPKIKIVQVWHERLHKDPAHQWLRQQLRI